MRTPLAFAIGSCLGQGKWAWFRKRSGLLSHFITFDEASRGPLGCVSLIWLLRSWHWASLGAWVTLALLAIDPFMQAVLLYDGQKDVVGLSDSRIPRATGMDVGEWSKETTLQLQYYGNNDVLSNYRVYPDIGMSMTTIFGFVNTSTTSPSQPPLVYCRTGNCTWPTYSSVGICSRCLDISEHLIKERGLGIPDESIFSKCYDSSSLFVTNYTTYAIPYSPVRRALIQNTNGFARKSACLPRARIGLSVVFRPNETYRFKDSNTLLASFALVELEAGYWNNQTAIEDAKARATECVLEFCGRVHEAEMRDGQVDESLVLETTLKPTNSFRPIREIAPDLMDRVEQDSKNSLAEFYITGFRSDSWGGIETVLERTDLQIQIPQTANLPGDVQETFNITQKSIVTLMNFLSANSTLDSITYAISNSTNLTTTFETAAHLISNRVREIDGSMANGFSEQWVIYIHVRWDYIYFPVIVLAAGYLFTIVVILDSFGFGPEVMKSDLLPTLLFGLDTQTRMSLRNEKSEEGKCKDRTLVMLNEDADGLALRTVT
ncbi:hypothetical protein F4776DRAFT_360289 [Hypoxylon sp. NC0597]|nr:hypothetical protein F4776DRAFT_360289 [Hypoxylon sp. NC0597]